MCLVGGEDAWWVFGAGWEVGENDGGREDRQRIGETVPAREVRGLASLVSKRWKWVMEWPLSVVKGNVKIEPSMSKEKKWVTVRSYEVEE
jgi:hypothetical protein